MVHYENDCVGCPQGCVNCGRKQSYPVWECDKCGKTSYTGEDIYKKLGEHYCEECYYKEFGTFENAITAKDAMEMDEEDWE